MSFRCRLRVVFHSCQAAEGILAVLLVISDAPPPQAYSKNRVMKIEGAAVGRTAPARGRPARSVGRGVCAAMLAEEDLREPHEETPHARARNRRPKCQPRGTASVTLPLASRIARRSAVW